jgi:hypothetical protein
LLGPIGSGSMQNCQVHVDGFLGPDQDLVETQTGCKRSLVREFSNHRSLDALDGNQAPRGDHRLPDRFVVSGISPV